MEYTRLGRTGLKVSRLCLGTMNFGPQTSEADSFRIMDRAHERGINFFDTANRYGQMNGVGQIGATEEIIGRWFNQGGGRRDRTVLATKIYGQMGDWPNESGVNALSLKRQCEASLRRLRTDYIDIYQMHHIPRGTPWEEIWQGMEQLVREGKILYVASSNFAGWHIAQANEAAKARHFMGLVSEQSHYHLLERTVELEVVPACRAYGLGLIPWSPLGGGLLGGILRKAAEGRRASAQVVANIEANRPALEAYEGLCRDLGEQPSDVALAWLLNNPVVTAPIIGPRTLEQLDGSLRAPTMSLTRETLERLEEIFPGPGKGHGAPAPEAYAW
ncbi:MAG TPA: aldo/keto reductase [Chloroflexota bacterium]|nr:aldo/keto reductase [Chloroflexota bacterium]